MLKTIKNHRYFCLFLGVNILVMAVGLILDDSKSIMPEITFLDWLTIAMFFLTPLFIFSYIIFSLFDKNFKNKTPLKTFLIWIAPILILFIIFLFAHLAVN